MAWKSIYATAFAAAFAAFAATGGIHAAEKAAVAVEREEKAAAAAPARPLGKDATIPFANSGNIRDWHPDGLNALYVQDARGQWYRASLMGPCNELPTTETIAFLTRGPDQLDKYSAVGVRGQRCQFSALVTSAAPSKRDKIKATAAKG
ncbi:MAG TPA: DUF6491 family protein [Sphingobium sp.]|uniref:DUF6491 family protein n=1 Tax=Sphingobium sp. TaxID=1912891 RepID=UPI002ED32137